MAKFKPLPPLERLNELFEVVEIPESQFGIKSGLVWRVSRGGQKAGDNAGYLKPCLDQKHRFDWQVRVDRELLYTARVIYYMMNGIDPGKNEVDHKDKNALNNNIANLRLSDCLLQAQNRKVFTSNTSGLVGVSWSTQKKKWVARLMYKRVFVLTSFHSCKISAAKKYNDKVIKLGLDKIGKPINDLSCISCGCSSCQNRPS